MDRRTLELQIKEIKDKLETIKIEYKDEDHPNTYKRDPEYIKLSKKLQYLTQYMKDLIKLEDVKNSRNKETFDTLPDEIKETLINAKYNITLDSDNILSFYRSNHTELADKTIQQRIQLLKNKF